MKKLKLLSFLFLTSFVIISCSDDDSDSDTSDLPATTEGSLFLMEQNTI